MPRLFITILLACIVSPASAQRKQLRQFTNDYAEIGDTHRFGFSFFPLRMVSWFIPGNAFDGEAKTIKWGLKKVRSVKLYVINTPEDKPILPQSIALLKKNLQEESGYEPLVEVRSKGQHIQLFSNGNGEDRLDHLVVLVQEENEMVMLHLKTRLTIQDVNRILNEYTDGNFDPGKLAMRKD
ncbi:DUF4252 domain-containing protein [Chitinophaga lutea]